MVKNLNKVFLIVVFIIIIGIVIINNNKDSFGATSTWTSGSWYSTFGPTGSTNYGFLQLQTNLPAGPYLLPDPGWTQPTQTNASIIACLGLFILKIMFHQLLQIYLTRLDLLGQLKIVLILIHQRVYQVYQTITFTQQQQMVLPQLYQL